ncbi:hypothetical protein G7074_13900 [Pedobacter sp. HDW13]|uniref:hypothetical protein n=1 Tax=Pedobacter sp. HDW13 TaxID=2714940 RepID=UPI00140C1996|nr:hypothetical protein [Pedobacter sp. HDW13]QIL40256.1 hypothetical protein G7074_13900 [Pedobacter sp. HDW13]
MEKLYKHLKIGEAKRSSFNLPIKLFSLIMLLSFTVFTAFAQTIKITGTVKDTQGE